MVIFIVIICMDYACSFLESLCNLYGYSADAGMQIYWLTASTITLLLECLHKCTAKNVCTTYSYQRHIMN